MSVVEGEVDELNVDEELGESEILELAKSEIDKRDEPEVDRFDKAEVDELELFSESDISTGLANMPALAK
ncbi:hypothetical protein FRC08_014789 [Ceratobasidium sp. 394]|nr:hypothetical protein FRC08_014789 [Ceratobasidium sp. 394]KAG9097165.1 hypothetical protein FS749_006916 [Ceratobasidium sp. UAMH 11750]